MALRPSLLSPSIFSESMWILRSRKNSVRLCKRFLTATTSCAAVSSKSRDQRMQRTALLRRNRRDAELERAARTGSLMVPLEEVQREWHSHRGLDQLQTAATHFNLFQDLYGRVFRPGGFMEVTYGDRAIYRGNILSPSEASVPPRVSGLPRDKGMMCSLILSNPDGHLLDHNMEILHWMIVNIEKGEMSSGEEVVPYLQPLPPRGSGLHRMVFSLFTHPSLITVSSHHHNNTGSWLDQRTFSTSDFLSSHPELQPFTFSLYQSQWDSSVHTVFMEHLVYPEPVYEVEKEQTARKQKEENTRLRKANRYRIF